MRAPLLSLLPFAAAALVLPSPRAQAQDKSDSPYFFVHGGDEALDQLPLKSTSVKVDVVGVIAEVKVTQVYRNTGKKALEAIYVFPGSTRAAVHGLRMKVGERTIEAKVKAKEEARTDYERARQEGRTASLLEQHRPNVFQMNVANILPGDEVKVELTYTELLTPKEGTYAFVFPTVVGPRYAGRPGGDMDEGDRPFAALSLRPPRAPHLVSGQSPVTRSDSHTGETWVGNPYTGQGEAPAATFDLDLALSAGMPIQRLACDTHRAAIAYQGTGSATLKLDPSEAKGANRDFILKYQLSGGQVQSGLILHKGEKENFFLVMAQPPKRVAPEQMPPREYVFIMDVSGSQHGFPLEVSKTLMKEMIQGLRPVDRFNVMVFEGSSDLCWAASQPASGQNISAALAFVGARNAGGGTELGSALKRALALPGTEGFSRTFIVSTDGYISADARVFDTIRANLGQANLFAFGIGSSVNRHLVEGMAHAGQGEAFVVTNPTEAPATAEAFRRYVSTPVLRGVKVEAKGFQTYDLEPSALPDVLAERPVLCFGKWKGDAAGSLTISGTTGRGPWHQTFDVSHAAASTSHPALRQLWARERIRLLADYEGLHQDHREEITRLGLAYNLLTAHTSFVAVDTVARGNGDSTRVVQPLPLPQGVSEHAIGGVASGMVAMPCAAPPPPSSYPSRMAKAELHRGVGAERPSTLGDVASVAEQAPEPKKAPRLLLRVTTDRKDANLADLRSRLAALLLDPAFAALPSHTPITLRVDAQGRILSAAFGRSFPGDARLKAALKARSLHGWKGTGTLEVTVVLG